MEGDASLYEDSYQLLTPSTGALSQPAPLPVLTDTWPVNLYPAIFVLPITSSIAVFAGEACAVLLSHCLVHNLGCCNAAFQIQHCWFAQQGRACAVWLSCFTTQGFLLPALLFMLVSLGCVLCC